MVDLEELERALAKMQPRQKLYELIKKELKSRGRWKNKPRGRPYKNRG